MQNKSGFTLIELLVVVLIIGILSAIAVPQYQKAILKSRFSQIDSIVNSSRKVVAYYLMSRGMPKDGQSVYFTGTERLNLLDGMPGNCDEDTQRCTIDDDIWWLVVCSNIKGRAVCGIAVYLYDWFDDEDDNAFYLTREKRTEDAWYLEMKFPRKEICQWAKDRNFPGIKTGCEKFGINLEPYESIYK